MQTKALCMTIAIGLAAICPAAAQKSRHQVAEQAPTAVKRSLFSGSESRVAELGWLSADCSTSTPDIRVVRNPSHGEVRFEEAKSVVSADKSALQKQCHGKPIEALRVYYKANSDFTGSDSFSLDVDTKLGFVKRYTFTMDVR
jgi:hypothetical protein